VNRHQSLVRWIIAVIAVTIGIVCLIYWAMSQGRVRTNPEDNFAWCVFALGSSLAGAGFSIPFCRPRTVFLIAVISPALAFGACVIVVWGLIIFVGPIIELFR
jgi:hypothetical protein